MSSKKDGVMDNNCIELVDLSKRLNVKRLTEPELKCHNDDIENRKTEALEIPVSSFSKMASITFPNNDEKNLPKQAAEEVFCKVIDEKYSYPYLQIRNQKRYLNTLNTNPRKYDTKFPIRNSTKKTFNHFFENLNEDSIENPAILSKNRKSSTPKFDHDQQNLATLKYDDNADKAAPEIPFSKVSENVEPKNTKLNCEKNSDNLTVSPLTASAIAFQSVLDHLNTLSRNFDGPKDYQIGLLDSSASSSTIANPTGIDEAKRNGILIKNPNFFLPTYNSVLEHARSVDIYRPSNYINCDSEKAIDPINLDDGSCKKNRQDTKLRNTNDQSTPVIVGYSAKQARSNDDDNNPNKITTAELVQQVTRSRLQLDRFMAARNINDWELTDTNTEKGDSLSKSNFAGGKASKRPAPPIQQQTNDGSEIVRYVEPFNYLVPLQNANKRDETVIGNPSSGEDEPALLNKDLVGIEQESVQTFTIENDYHSEPVSRINRIRNWIVQSRYIFMDVGIFFFLFGILFFIFIIINIVVETTHTNDFS